MAADKDTKKVGRDAKTGQFVPLPETKRRPSTTEVETVKTGKGGKKK